MWTISLFCLFVACIVSGCPFSILRPHQIFQSRKQSNHNSRHDNVKEVRSIGSPGDVVVMESVLNFIYSHAFRGLTVKRQDLVRNFISVDRLVKSGIITNPRSSRFIPHATNHKPAIEFLKGVPSGPAEHVTNTLDLLNENWGSMSSGLVGEVFERMHISWILGMRSHHANQSFLPNGRDTSLKEHRAKFLFLQCDNPEKRARVIKYLDSLPKGTLTDCHNGYEPLKKSTELDEPFLLHSRYKILQLPGSSSMSVPVLGQLSDEQLAEMLTSTAAYKNVPNGAGFDFIIIDWIPEGERGFKIMFTFMEMRYSYHSSPLRQSMEEVEKKFYFVKREFEAVKQRLSDKFENVQFDFRLVMECFRDLKSSFDHEQLPEKVFLYDRELLGRGYGPSLTSSHNLAAEDYYSQTSSIKE